MSAYSLSNKTALVTGGGSGINLSLCTKLLLAGTNVIVADLSLRPEAEEIYNQYPHPHPPSHDDSKRPSAVFIKTDMANWSSIKSTWNQSLSTFGQIDIVVNGAGIYEPPLSSFWELPGVSALAGDDPDAEVGQYRTFGVNTIGPIRLAQIAIDYWLKNREVQGNLCWVASMGGYVHSIQSPMYFASKAAVVSMVRSLGMLRKEFGIRNSCICPGAVYTPIFHPDYCKDRIHPDDLSMTPDQCADIIVSLLTEAQYGDGNVVECMVAGTLAESKICVREVPLEALYPTAGVIGEANHLYEAEAKFVKQMKETYRS